jgi:hypothetical protein
MLNPSLDASQQHNIKKNWKKTSLQQILPFTETQKENLI